MTQDSEAVEAVMAALRARNLEGAADLAEAALGRGVEAALLLNLRAWRHETAGRLGDALSDLLRARQLAPDDLSTLNALGLCLARHQRLVDAVEAFDAAIGVNPAFAPAHFNRGWVSEELGELDQARTSFQTAARLEPRDPNPLARLSALAARASDWPGARDLATRVLAVRPGEPTASLALASAEAADGDLDAASARLRALAANPAISPIDRAQAQGSLGDLLERQQRPAEAFAQFAAANETLRHIHAPRFSGPGVQTVPQMLSWLTRYFQTATPASWRGAPVVPDAGEPAVHVFLLGFPRSGTTLLERVLTTSPGVIASEERETLTEATMEWLRNPATLDRLAAISATDAARHRRLYWDRVRAFGDHPAGRVFIDKLPLNSIKLPLIAKLFPAAKILFAVRDPRDVVLSCFRQRFRVNPSMYEFLTLEGAARFYAQVMGLSQIYRARFELDLHVHRYEDLIADFEATAQGVCGFIGVDWSPDMRRFDQHGARRAIATPSSVQVSRGLYDGGGQWRRYADQMAPAIPYLRPWIEHFGYQ